MKFFWLILASLVAVKGQNGSAVGAAPIITCDQIIIARVGQTNTYYLTSTGNPIVANSWTTYSLSTADSSYPYVAPHVQVNSQTILFGLWTNATVETQVPLTVTTNGCAGVTLNVTHSALSCNSIWILDSPGRIHVEFLNGPYSNVNYTATSNVSAISLAPSQGESGINNDLSSNLTTITPVAFTITTAFCPSGVVINTIWYPPSCDNLVLSVGPSYNYYLTDVYGNGGFYGVTYSNSNPLINVAPESSGYFIKQVYLRMTSNSQSIISTDLTVTLPYCTKTYHISYVPYGQSLPTTTANNGQASYNGGQGSYYPTATMGSPWPSSTQTGQSVTCNQLSVSPLGQKNQYFLNSTGGPLVANSDSYSVQGLTSDLLIPQGTAYQFNSQSVVFWVWAASTNTTVIGLRVTTSGCPGGVTFNVTHFAPSCDTIIQFDSPGRLMGAFSNGPFGLVPYTITSNVSSIGTTHKFTDEYLNLDLNSTLTTITPVAFTISTNFCPTGAVFNTVWYPPSCANFERLNYNNQNYYFLEDQYGNGGFNSGNITASNPDLQLGIQIVPAVNGSRPRLYIRVDSKSNSQNSIYDTLTVTSPYCNTTYPISFTPYGSNNGQGSNNGGQGSNNGGQGSYSYYNGGQGSYYPTATMGSPWPSNQASYHPTASMGSPWPTNTQAGAGGTCGQISVTPIGMTNTYTVALSGELIDLGSDSYHVALVSEGPSNFISMISSYDHAVQSLVYGIWTIDTSERYVNVVVHSSGCSNGIVIPVIHYAPSCSTIRLSPSPGSIQISLGSVPWDQNFLFSTNVTGISGVEAGATTTTNYFQLISDLKINTPVQVTVQSPFCNGVSLNTTYNAPSCNYAFSPSPTPNLYHLNDYSGFEQFSKLSSSNFALTQTNGHVTFMVYTFSLQEVQIVLSSIDNFQVDANLTVTLGTCILSFPVTYYPNGNNPGSNSSPSYPNYSNLPTATSTYYPAYPTGNVLPCQSLSFTTNASTLTNTLTITLNNWLDEPRTFKLTDSEGALQFTPNLIWFGAHSESGSRTVTFEGTGSIVPSGTIIILTDHNWCAKYVKYLLLVQ